MTGLTVARHVRLRDLRAAQKLAWEAYVAAGLLLYTPEAKAARAAYLDATEAVIDLSLTTNQEQKNA